MVNPCLGCSERWVGDHTNCHASCKRYQKWTLEHAKEVKAAREAKKLDRVWNRYRYGHENATESDIYSGNIH